MLFSLYKKKPAVICATRLRTCILNTHIYPIICARWTQLCYKHKPNWAHFRGSLVLEVLIDDWVMTFLYEYNRFAWCLRCSQLHVRHRHIGTCTHTLRTIYTITMRELNDLLTTTDATQRRTARNVNRRNIASTFACKRAGECAQSPKWFVDNALM